MSTKAQRLRPGTIVQLRPPREIIGTLDGDGALGHLPFMPEMLDGYGQRFRVARRALTVCYYGPGAARRFTTDDVVTLEGVRCLGGAHEGCQKACTIFWREAWLAKANGAAPPTAPQDVEALRARLKISQGDGAFYCQASELLKATTTLSRSGRLTQYVNGLRAGNFSALEMVCGVWTFLLLWARRKLSGSAYRKERRKRTPVEALNLQPGEWVEVKSFEAIADTLDANGHNRGLYFSPDMRRWCGRKLRVRGRLEKLIKDGTGEMKTFSNTVALEGSTCGCAYMGLGMAGCSRCELSYWREIWLRRCDVPSSSAPSRADADHR